MKNRLIFLLKCSPLLAVLLIGACSQASETTKKGAEKKEPLVKVAPVKKASMVSFANLTGTVRANVFSDISSPVEGILEKLSVRENDFVKKGGLVAVISSNDRNALIANSRFKLVELENKLAKTDKNSPAAQDMQQQLDQARKESAYAASVYQPYPVVAPLSGVVTKRYFDQGSLLTARQPFITITDMSSLVVKVELNEKYFAKIKKGDKIDVRLNAYPGKSISGVVALINPDVNQVSRTIMLDIKLLGFSEKILPGMMAEIKIPIENKHDIIAIGNDAILTKPSEKKFVFVVQNGIARERLIATGMITENVTEITSGLQAGDLLVVMGQQMLKDGTKVKVLPPESAKK